MANSALSAGQGPGVMVAATVAALPNSPEDGAVAFLRIGSSPYEFVTMIYDATAALWVDAAGPQRAFTQTTDTVSTSTSYTEAGGAAAGDFHPFPYKALKDAGLKLQVRLIARLDRGGTSTIEVAVAAEGANFGGNFAGPDLTNTSGEVSDNAGTQVFKDSGWVDLNASVTSRDLMVLRLAVKRTGANNGNLRNYSHILRRWVAVAA